jgi:hypothetical protein
MPDGDLGDIVHLRTCLVLGKPSHGLRGAIFRSPRTASVLASFVFCLNGAMKKMRMIMDDTN